MVQTAGDDSRTDDPFEIAAQGVPGANPLYGGPTPDSADKVDAPGTILPDGRPEAGISGRSVRTGDRVFKGLAAGSGAILLIVMAAIAIFLVWKAIPAFTGNSGDLFTTQTWNPQGTPPVFGMAAVFFGTVMSAFIAMLVVFGAHEFVWGTTSTVVRQRAVPDALMGRVGSVYRIAIMGGIVIGTPTGGLLARQFGITAPFWFGFFGSALLVAVLWREFAKIVLAGETPPELGV